jgi:hypothetical protein
MGLGNQSLTYLERLAGPLSTLLVKRWLGPRLKAAFGSRTVQP